MEYKYKCRCGKVFDKPMIYSVESFRPNGGIGGAIDEVVSPCCLSEVFTMVYHCELCDSWKLNSDFSAPKVCISCAIKEEKKGIPVYKFWKQFRPSYVSGMTEEDFKGIYYRFREYEAMDLLLEGDFQQFCKWLLTQKEGKNGEM